VGSVLGGGKFKNGAVTAAFGYMFNSAKHPASNKTTTAQKGDGFFKNLWKKATAWHFEKRHAANGPLLS
jgi:hypothetical protein